MKQKDYDRRQTAACDYVRRMLQSIAIQAVEAQDHIGADKCADLLSDILNDADRALRMNEALTSDDTSEFPE
jgi:hypothetical protein